MGFDNECIINIQSLAGEYFCPVCRLLVYPNEALQTQCTHLYCKPCLTYVARTSQACPYDGYLVTESDSKPLVESNKSLADTIGKVSVHCLFHRSGCTWQGPLSECISHCSGCAFGNSPVVCNRCGVQIVHRQVQEHAQSCSGVQSQSQPSDVVQSSAATGASAAPKQNPAGSQAVPSPSQPQTSHASSAPPALTSQRPSQQASLTSQVQASQVALPTPDQWYQQQQQYQQYYQQYPGYYPYQQQYQQYYPYQQHPAQQYPHQSGQTYPSQVPGQYPSQPQQPPQAPAPVQAQLLPHAQASASAQQQAHPIGQPQPHPQQLQGQNQVASQNQQHLPAQPYPQAHHYTQPIAAQSGAQQPIQVPQYQQTHPQIQPLHPQMQPQPYSQPLTQSYSHLQIQPQTQPLPQPSPNPPLQPNQPTNQSAQAPAQNPSAHAVTGHQPYPQPQPLQLRGPHVMPVTAAFHPLRHPGQMQGQLPQQPTQMRPPQAYAMTLPQQQSPMLPSQAQYLGAPVTQVPVYPPPQQPGYPAQQRPCVQPTQEVSVQQQSHLGQGPSMQRHPPMHASLCPQGPAQMCQHYPDRPMIPQGVAQHSYAQATVVANTSRIQAAHPGMNQPSVNQTYPFPANNQSSPAVDGQQSLKPCGVEKHGDQTMMKDNLEQGNVGTYSVEIEKLRSKEGVDGLDDKKNLSGSSNKDHSVQKQMLGDDSGLLMGEKKEVGIGAMKLSPASKSAEIVPKKESEAVQGLDKGSSVPCSASTQFASQVPGHQLQPMSYGPSHQQRPVGPSMLQSISHSSAHQNLAFLGQPPSQLGPQVPGKIPPAQPLGMHEKAQASILKQPSGSLHPENPSGCLLGPGSVAPFGRGPDNLAPSLGPSSQGNIPHPARNSPGELFGGPPFDSHVVVIGRTPPLGTEGSIAQLRPPNPMDGPGIFDGRQPDLLLHDPMEPAPFGQHSKTTRVPGRDPLSAHALRDERLKMLHDEHLRPFPGGIPQAVDCRDLQDLKKFPGPPRVDGGPMGKSGSNFPPPRVLDKASYMDGDPGPFEKAPVGVGPASSRLLPPSHPGSSFHPNDAVPGFGHHAMVRSPGRNYGGAPAHGFRGSSGGDLNRIEPCSFGDGSKVFNSFSDPFGKSVPESCFSVAPGRLKRGEFDGPRNLHSRYGDVIGQEMPPENFRPSTVHPGEGPDFGTFEGRSLMGYPPLLGSFLPHQPFSETFGRDRSGYPRIGEPGFRSSYSLHRYANDGRFYPGEAELFNNPRNRKLASIMCRICEVDCETVEGLDLHSQTREHQKRAMDMVLSIKRQNVKKQKTGSDGSSLEEGSKPRNASFVGRRNRR